MNTSHYNDSYFNWQSPIGKFGGWANSPKFSRYIQPNDTVLDFGCGGGWLLNNLNCSKKFGIEINPAAAKAAKEFGITVYSHTAQLPDNFIDVIISNHALEHVHNPLSELSALKTKLKANGKAIFVVPSESSLNPYKPDDVNHHLYTWNPMCLGNLFEEAGFQVVESKLLLHAWPPKYELIAKIGGRALFDFACWVYALIKLTSFAQIKIVAIKDQ